VSATGGGSESTTELPSFVDLLPVDAHTQFWGLTKHDLVPIIMSAIISVIYSYIEYRKEKRRKK